MNVYQKIGSAVMIGSIVWFGSGCGALMGFKEIETAGGTKISFITGADFRIGANGLDTVDNNTGIKPGIGYRSAGVSSVKYTKGAEKY